MGLPNVINFHITEACNYRCKYCFSKFNVDGEFKLEKWKQVTNKFSNYFKDNKLKGRINITGGEPMIAPYFFQLVDYIHGLGIDVSIITNASRLNNENVDKLVGKVSTIGISIDSLNYNKKLEIGRVEGSKTFEYDELVNTLKYIKNNNINLKVNTVISKLNLDEDIIRLYKDVEFDRIKLLQVRVNEGSNDIAKEFEITEEEFKIYVKKIRNKVKEKLIIEGNEDIENAYIIIDPKGRMISNNNNKHIVVGDVLKEGIEDLIKKTNYNHQSFSKRY